MQTSLAFRNVGATSHRARAKHSPELTRYGMRCLRSQLSENVRHRRPGRPSFGAARGQHAAQHRLHRLGHADGAERQAGPTRAADTEQFISKAVPLSGCFTAAAVIQEVSACSRFRVMGMLLLATVA